MCPSSPRRSAQPAREESGLEGAVRVANWESVLSGKDVASLVSVWLDITHVKNKPGFPSDFSVVEEEESLGCRV